MDKEMNTISVVVPIYNSEKSLDACVASICNQTYTDLDIILVNDGSKDRSKEICERFCGLDQRVRLIDKENQGVLRARLDGIHAAKGRWIAFVDSDDTIAPDMLARLAARLQNEDGDMIVLSSYTVKPSDLTQYDALDSHGALEYLCKLQFPTSMWSGVYKAELVKSLELPADIHFFEDFVFMFRMLRASHKILLCHDRLYNYLDSTTNRAGLTAKRLSCLQIIPLLLPGGSLFDSALGEKPLFACAHFLVCNIICLRKNTKDELRNGLLSGCKQYRGMLLRAKQVPILYKCLILLCSVSTGLTQMLMELRRTGK